MIQNPAVYVVQKDFAPGQIVPVATAIPVFIGYTQKADNNRRSLRNVPCRVGSMAEFEKYFGWDPFITFHVVKFPFVGTTVDSSVRAKAFFLGSQDYAVVPSKKPEQQFFLYWSVALFFQNGGAACYIVSVGDYGNSIADTDLIGGLNSSCEATEPALVVIPEAVRLSTEAACIEVQRAVLQHCGKKQSRFAILDIYDGWRSRTDADGDCVTTFRNHLGSDSLDYAAAYYPWLNTSIVTDADLSYENVAADDLTAILTAEGAADAAVIAEITRPTGTYSARLLNKMLRAASPVFVRVMAAIRKQMNLLPPAAAIAGIYSTVDRTAGVWRAPANVLLTGVVSPAVAVSQDDMDDFNADLQGKAVNAIRSFLLVPATADAAGKSTNTMQPIPGEGVLVCSAKTMDSNSPDWRDIQVRRTLIFVEQSLKSALQNYCFEGNNAKTWESIKASFGNFLNAIWKQGGLFGETPNDAFAVQCGQGETMTANDIVENILRVSVLVAVKGPADFIVITLQQQMQQA